MKAVMGNHVNKDYEDYFSVVCPNCKLVAGDFQNCTIAEIEWDRLMSELAAMSNLEIVYWDTRENVCKSIYGEELNIEENAREARNIHGRLITQANKDIDDIVKTIDGFVKSYSIRGVGTGIDDWITHFKAIVDKYSEKKKEKDD